MGVPSVTYASCWDQLLGTLECKQMLWAKVTPYFKPYKITWSSVNKGNHLHTMELAKEVSHICRLNCAPVLDDPGNVMGL